MWSPGEFIFEFRAKYKENAPIFEKIRKLSSMKESDDLKQTGIIEMITLKDYVGIGKHGESLHQPLNFTFEKNHLYLVKGENGSGKNNTD